MNRAEQFERLYNDLDRFLRTELESRNSPNDRNRPFASVLTEVSTFNATVRNRKAHILEMADLRNAIVHSRGRNGVSFFAEPFPEVLEEIESLVASVRSPRRAFDICSKNPRLFSLEEQLGEVLQYMKEKSFSQVLVRSDSKTQVLSQVGIIHWLEVHVIQSIVEIGGVELSHLLRHEPEGSHDFVDRDASVDEVRDMFTALPKHTSERLQSVIVTNSGKSSEAPIGIITAWDLVE